jgi:hypothetical protein
MYTGNTTLEITSVGVVLEVMKNLRFQFLDKI